MRYLQIFTVIIFIISVLFFGWTSTRYYSGLNTDNPTITNSVEQLEISVEDPPEALFQGLAAEDKTDGDLTDQIMVASVSHFLEPGTVNVKYVVFDKHNNSATLTRKVHYTDYQSPRFYLDKAPVYVVGNSFDLLEHIWAYDYIDGDISDRIRVISNMVNNYSAGSYPVILEVSNSYGDTSQLMLWVTYLSKASTASVKLHQNIAYVEAGETFDPYRWIASVTDQNSLTLSTSNIEIQGNLDVDTPGFYQLVYNYNDGSRTGQSTLTVVVMERQD